MSRSMRCFCLSILLSLAVVLSAAASPATIPGAYGKLPLTFEANQGQADPAVRFLSRGSRYTLFLTPDEAVLSLQGATGAVVRMQMAGANREARITAEKPAATRTNYLRGNDPRKWRTGVANFEQVRYGNAWPGIDVVYRGNEQQLEYDFVLAPKTSPAQIRLAFRGAESMKLGANGELVLHTAAGDLVQPRPYVYQESHGKRHQVDARYALRTNGEIGFVLGRYDRNRAVVIDPVLVYSTYLGGDLSDQPVSVAVDGSGNTYITGVTMSSTFPGVTGGSIQSSLDGDRDAFVTKINAAGTAIVYSTYLGGDGDYEFGLDIDVDSSGNAYITGATDSSDFPGAGGSSIQPAFGGGFSDSYAAKLNAAGDTLVYSTYLGGDGGETSYAIAVDGSGNAYVAGSTDSTAFPGVTGSSIQPSINGDGDTFLTKINAAGTAIVYSTYLGGSASEEPEALRVDGSGNAYIAGYTTSSDFPGVTGSSPQSVYAGEGDGFVTKINAAGTAISFSTYLGGSEVDEAQGIALDGSGNIYVSGTTESSTFPGVSGSSIQPALAGGSDTIVTKINAAGTAIVYSTYLGGSDGEDGRNIGVDSSGNAYVCGITTSSDYPVTSGTLQSSYGGNWDVAVAKINAAGTAVAWATYLGGSGSEVPYGMTVDGAGNVYLAGLTNAAGFPGASGSTIQSSYAGGDWDGYVAKISNGASPSLTSISPASGVPGTHVTLTGTGFGAVRGSGSVWLGNKLAGSIVSWSSTQIEATVDSNVATGSASVQQGGTWSSSITFTIVTPTISSISPSSGVAGTQVTINGTNFGATQGSGSVWLGSKLAGSIVSWSATQIVATVASGSVSGSVQVQQSGVWGNSLSFTVNTPNITAVSPTTARAGDSITITGTGFGSTQGSGSVWLGSKLAGSIVSWSATQIVATVASGSVTGTVQAQQGGVWNNFGTFTVITPVLSSISPTSGPVGTQVTFTGTGFGSTQGSGKVWLANKYATIVSWSDTQVVATVISGSSTSASQVLQNGVWSNTITFTVTP